MKVVLVRHGEPDYSGVRARKFIGHGNDLASLTSQGKEQAQNAAENPALDGVELIVSSPYTRALQTAAIISRHRNIPIEVELDLHEWLPDLQHTFSTEEFVKEAARLLDLNKGTCPADSPIKYEELSNIFDRASKVLNRYTGYDKIAVVAHGMLLLQFSPLRSIGYCGISEIEYDKDFKWCGWVE